MKISLFVASMVLAANAAADLPVNTYFSLAVTENSHNHAGDNLLYLDFQQQLDSAAITPRVVVSPRLKGAAITLDGQLDDWNSRQFSRIQARVMNNYPLSEYYDAVPGEIEVASAHDGEHLYFALRFTDANHDASINRNRWHFDGQQWRKQPHVKPNPGTPASRAINATDSLGGGESEDRVLFMFPIVDRQGNFRDGSHGCAGYCHTELVQSGDPREQMIGEEVVKMHTALADDRADIWHWTSSRSAPANTLKDAHLTQEDRVGDSGQAPDQDNDYRKRVDKNGPAGPAYVSRKDYSADNYRKPGFSTALLPEEDLLPVTPDMVFATGASVPYSVTRPSTGSRGDVTVVSHYNPDTYQWTLEFQRKLATGNADDHDFTQGDAATRPTLAVIEPGDPALGAKLFKEKKCFSCHGDQGEGKFRDGHWQFPRIQRASGPLIFKTADHERPKRTAALSFKVTAGAPRPDALMPYIDISAQEAEHVASWLQTQFIPRGQ